MRRLGSIASRIFWLHLATLAAAALVMAASIYLLLNATLTSFERHTLSEHAAALAKAIEPTSDGVRLVLPPFQRDLYAEGYGGYAFAVVDASGRPLFSSLPDGSALFSGAPPRATPTFFQRPRGRNAFYGASYPERVGGSVVWIQVRQNLENPDVFVDDVVAQFLARIGWWTAPIILVLLAADILIVQRALTPVRDASEQAEAIDPRSMSVRLPTSGLPSEVKPLVLAMNRALDRLELGFRIQREFTSDVAHELRTPLAILRLRADTLADREIAERVRADVDAMSRVVDQLLAIAELETFELAASDRVDLRSLSLELCSFLAPLAIAANKQLELCAGDEPVWVKGRSDVLFRALRNIVENAIAHTPRGGSVRIDVDPAGAISVSDEGPGIREGDREQIFQRFWRRDRQAGAGIGLGLNIVQKIVQAHDGVVEVAPAATGGAQFVVRLRVAAP